MHRKFFVLCIASVLGIVGVAVSIYFYFNYSLLYGGVRTFGPLKMGADTPIGPGSYTFFPPKEIPKSHFYISVVQKGLWCVFEECSPEGLRIEALGGWLQGENTKQPEIRDIFGLEENTKVSSIIVVSDQNAKIIGIYPNKTTNDLANILKIHSKLIK